MDGNQDWATHLEKFFNSINDLSEYIISMVPLPHLWLLSGSEHIIGEVAQNRIFHEVHFQIGDDQHNTVIVKKEYTQFVGIEFVQRFIEALRDRVQHERLLIVV